MLAALSMLKYAKRLEGEWKAELAEFNLIERGQAFLVSMQSLSLVSERDQCLWLDGKASRKVGHSGN